jgi:hypothetical protein
MSRLPWRLSAFLQEVVMSAAISQSPAHTWFMQNLPEIQSRSRACLSRLPGHQREEALAEVTAAIFKASVSAERNGVLARITPFHAVVYAVKHYRQGRRLAGYSSTDVMSDATQIKGRCKVVSLESAAPRESGDRHSLTLAETLADRRQDNSPFEQVRQNMDYPSILRNERVSRKARKVFMVLTQDRTLGHGQRMACELKVTPGRVTQLKGELAEALARHDYGPTPTGQCWGA